MAPAGVVVGKPSEDVRSPHHFSSKCPGEKSCWTRSGAGGASRSGTVVRLRRRRWPPSSRCLHIRRSTRLRLTVCRSRISEAHTVRKGTYGVRRVHAELRGLRSPHRSTSAAGSRTAGDGRDCVGDVPPELLVPCAWSAETLLAHGGESRKLTHGPNPPWFYVKV